ncbi:MAG: DnaJ domain-containing protein [Paludibacteraceae bacterium]|nr:DnaJ domain-containing protein [Paludibacteraceae bacterium]
MITDTKIRYYQMADGLTFMVGPVSGCSNVICGFLAFFIACIIFCGILSDYSSIMSAAVILLLVFFFLLIEYNYNNSNITFTKDGFEVVSPLWLGLRSVRKTHKWENMEYWKLETFYDKRQNVYLHVKDKDENTECKYDYSMFGYGLPTRSDCPHPFGCGETFPDFFNYLEKVSNDTSFSKYILKTGQGFTSLTAQNYILSRVCCFNRSACQSQLQILASKGYELYDDVEFEYDNEGFCDAMSLLRGKDRDNQKDFVDLLFKLAVTDDGLKNDEWYFLQQVMLKLGFNSKWRDYYNSRFSSLRTESDYYYEQSSTTSSAPSVNSLQAYYNVLGLSTDADVSQLQNAYHKLALEHHPDLPKNANRVAECEATMAKINEAYIALRTIVKG